MKTPDWQNMLPAYVVGTLDPDQASALEQQLATDHELHAEYERYRAVFTQLSLEAEPIAPPPEIKQRLLARVHHEQRLTTRRWSRMSLGFVIATMLVVVLLGGALLATSNQLAKATASNTQLSQELQDTQQTLASLQQERQNLAAELATAQATAQQLTTTANASREQLAQLQAQINSDEQTMQFLTASDLASRPLKGRSSQGSMFMRPGHPDAVVLINGLPPLDATQSYQLWVASGNSQVNVGALTFGTDGTARLQIRAPAPIDSYTQMMVTIEHAEIALAPSAQVVLQGSLL